MKRFNEIPFSHRVVPWECDLDVIQGGPEFLKGNGGSC